MPIRQAFGSFALVGLSWLPWGAHAQAVDTTTVVRQHATLVDASCEDALAGATELQRAVKALVAGPSSEGLTAARTAWLEAREWYGQTEAYRP